jgi:hypothetical protein
MPAILVSLYLEVEVYITLLMRMYFNMRTRDLFCSTALSFTEQYILAAIYQVQIKMTPITRKTTLCLKQVWP